MGFKAKAEDKTPPFAGNMNVCGASVCEDIDKNVLWSMVHKASIGSVISQQDPSSMSQVSLVPLRLATT